MGEGSLLKQNFTQSFYSKLTLKFQTLENSTSDFSNCSSSVVWPEIYHFSPLSFSSPSVCGRSSVLPRLRKKAFASFHPHPTSPQGGGLQFSSFHSSQLCCKNYHLQSWSMASFQPMYCSFHLGVLLLAPEVYL